MKNYLLLLLIAYIACQERQEKGTGKNDPAVNRDTIPVLREEVNKNAVASYLISIDNPALEYKFGVSVYETPQTFKYLLRMQYEGMIETDTLKIPNFGIWPTVEVKPGKEKQSCIIGFLDKNKKFKEYKQLSVIDGQLTLTVLKRYGVGVYQKNPGVR